MIEADIQAQSIRRLTRGDSPPGLDSASEHVRDRENDHGEVPATRTWQSRGKPARQAGKGMVENRHVGTVQWDAQLDKGRISL